jgi:DNA-directed RNA polymerase specialized sigma24 family protein
VLHYENLGYEEIATALEMTFKAVERLLAFGRERVQDVLGSRMIYLNTGTGVFQPSLV